MSDEVAHMEPEAAAACISVGLHTLAAPPTRPPMSSQRPLGGLAATGGPQPRWRGGLPSSLHKLDCPERLSRALASDCALPPRTGLP